ncbi:hypothetical protein NDU88_004091 [Pleurodeles waltl]|uniref:Uncharacterized protein n=1 Tax=Pleurodeles waltl TaxID=8319 RepID=A0AAV7M5C3_PLEWA|nr:hypothetical protein NDU88_004091 [Pleurodeles waltl]
MGSRGPPQGNTMDHYALPGLVSQGASRHGSIREGQNEELGEPSWAELRQTIQGSRQVLESKIETVAIEVGLLRTDLRKRSLTGSADGRVEIQADRTMALAALDQSDVAPYATSMNQELTSLTGIWSRRRYVLINLGT